MVILSIGCENGIYFTGNRSTRPTSHTNKLNEVKKMELTYENMVQHMDNYFADYNLYAADNKTLPKMLKYYTRDIMLISYTLHPEKELPLEKILRAMNHPGLHEEFTPNYYVVDERRKVVVVQMINQFSEESTGRTFPPKQLSVHYYMVLNEKQEVKFNKILFFVEKVGPGEGDEVGKLMIQYRGEPISIEGNQEG